MPLPGFIAPQLATAREDVPSGDGWVHEIKFDGYRMLAYVENGAARLLSRNTLDWSRRFGQVTEALADIRAKEAIVDGEVCVLDERGRADFQKLQALVEDGKPARLSYLVFDLLWLDGEDLRKLPLLKRKAALAKIVPKRNAVVQYVDHLEPRGADDGVKFFAGACESGLEGTIAKRKDAPYDSGRTTSWIKVKCVDAREFVVCGYVPSERRSYFKSLVLGERTRAGLVHRGQVGGGFTEALGTKIQGLLAPLETEAPPFEKVPWELRNVARWVKPEYLAQVRFTEITREGSLRHPRFVSLRHRSEPGGTGEHLRSRTLADRKPKRKRKTKRKPARAPADERPALIEALKASVRKKPARGRR